MFIHCCYWRVVHLLTPIHPFSPTYSIRGCWSPSQQFWKKTGYTLDNSLEEKYFHSTALFYYLYVLLIFWLHEHCRVSTYKSDGCCLKGSVFFGYSEGWWFNCPSKILNSIWMFEKLQLFMCRWRLVWQQPVQPLCEYMNSALFSSILWITMKRASIGMICRDIHLNYIFALQADSTKYISMKI